MKRTLWLLAGTVLLAGFFASCEQDNAVSSDNLVARDVIDRIQEMGYSTENIQKIDEGYLVEGDIVLTQADLDDHTDHVTLRIAETEQYRTTNLVTGLPRTITFSMDATLRSTNGYQAALNEIVNRYNAENLGLTFVDGGGNSGGTIHFKKQGGNFLASAGFPSGGNPYPLVKLNSNAIGSGTSPTFINYCATIMAHEVGHCIGFRHTDYMNRAYSCGGSPTNEGSAGVGAIHIPGTPTGPDAASWMLACIGSGQNRPFNANDQIALGYLY
jgi:hypothetical protein